MRCSDNFYVGGVSVDFTLGFEPVENIENICHLAPVVKICLWLKTYRQWKTKYKIYVLVKLNKSIGKYVLYFQTMFLSSIAFHAI